MLGVCYYPEHWPEAVWADDAAQMRALGLTYVRIGEFAWSRLEPRPGEYAFDWLDRAIAVLGENGLKVVLGTPTATPPKWLVDLYPEILPVDPASGRVRGFGSRRHYDFSSETYLRESLRITEQLAIRYGGNPHVVGWQTDNEYCCHDTALSASATARDAFREWCAQAYQSIDALNQAWGNVFWSMEYGSFDDIELPFGTVCETNPAHRLAFRRFTSDQVVRFNRLQTDVIRRHAPGQFVTHNFIPPQSTGIDNDALARSLDFASYDSYPLGFTDRMMQALGADAARPFMRTGHPDLTTFHLDQIRGLSRGPFWIMEQQPGPVNWAPHNPRPAPGMVRLWTIQAFAHGADCVSYFRWRQAPFAQEQMHAGLLRPDRSKADAWAEIEQVQAELAGLGLADHPRSPAPVAIIVDVEALWLSEIEPQGAGYEYEAVLFQWYRALRQIGVDADFVMPGADLTAYRLVLAPCLAMPDDAAIAALAVAGGPVVIGPRSGAKTREFTLPDSLPPGPLQQLLPLRVLSVETLRPDCPEPLHWNGRSFDSHSWREMIDVREGDVVATYDDGTAAAVCHGQFLYLASLTDDSFLRALFTDLCDAAAIPTVALDPMVRLQRRGNLTFAFNFAAEPRPAPAAQGGRFTLGGPIIEAHGVSVWINL
ncbi:MAG: beta-galactosidase [Erythrobacter sp.]|nr:beta-galactosidase [Erythrobacter sp.]MDZ4271488.1 beta-galactosidase [Erythrobacter sp.]